MPCDNHWVWRPRSEASDLPKLGEGALPRAAPDIGENGRAILAELDFSEAEISDFIAGQAVMEPRPDS